MADEDVGANGDSEAAPEGSAAAAIQGMLGRITTAELVIAIAALWVLVVSYLIGDVITDDWGVSSVEWLIALGILVGMYFYHRSGDAPWRPHYWWLLAIGAWALAATGIMSFFEEIFDEGSYSGARRFYWATEWLAGIAFLVGALMLRRQRSQAG